MKVIPETRRTF